MAETFAVPVAVYERMMIMLRTATQSAREVELPQDLGLTDDFLLCVYNDEIEACQSIVDRVELAYETRKNPVGDYTCPRHQ